MRALLIALGLLAGCGPSTQDHKGAPLQAEEGNAAQSAPVLPAVVAPTAAPFDWTGTWAATRDLCTGGRWQFRRDGVTTDGETSCTGDPASVSPNGASLALTCQAEGVTTREHWELIRTSEHGMRVRRTEGRRMIAEVALKRCR